VAEHRPEAHRRYLEWTPVPLLSWASHGGPNTAGVRFFKDCGSLKEKTERRDDEDEKQASLRQFLIDSNRPPYVTVTNPGVA